MEINQLITTTLKEVNLPLFFISKPQTQACKEIKDYITFNYYVYDDFYSNNDSEVERYLVSFNLITSDQNLLLGGIKKIKNVLKKNSDFYNVIVRGATVNNVNSVLLDEYIVTITCNYIYFREDESE